MAQSKHEMGDVNLPLSRPQISCVSWCEQLTMRVIPVSKEKYFHVAWLPAHTVSFPCFSPAEAAEGSDAEGCVAPY